MSSTPAAPLGVRSLSFHSQYGCMSTGECCTAGWPIPIEADRLARARLAIASGLLRPADATAGPWLTPQDAPADTPALVGVSHDTCVFFDREGRRRCRIQSALGHDALPLACRQFPRVAVVDPRGVSVTLSHYCPTAAHLLVLDEHEPVAIDDGPKAFPIGGEYVGLDVRSSLPPSLRADVLMDWASWWEWERLAVHCLTDRTRPIDDALDVLCAAVEYARTWSPGGGALIDHVRRSFTTPAPSRSRARKEHGAVLVQEVMRAVPAEFRSMAWTSSWQVPRPADATTGRFLAAHAFANWTAHMGRGLRAWHRSIEAAMALLDAGSGVRQADLLLRHLAETSALTSAWDQAEVSGALL